MERWTTTQPVTQTLPDGTYRIILPCYGIVIERRIGYGGTIHSQLKDGVRKGSRLAAAMDALESIILAHEIAGVDIATPAYLEGIEEAVQAVWDHFARE